MATLSSQQVTQFEQDGYLFLEGALTGEQLRGLRKDFEKWKKFVAEKQLGGVQLFADKDWNSDFMKSYSINSIPRFILIDPTGKVVSADASRPSNPKLAEQLDALLK